MALTDFCDVFGSFHEDGFNRIIRHIQRQRPSLFNYGTSDMQNRLDYLCAKINAHPAVKQFQNPYITVSPYLPIPGYMGPFGMSYIMQLHRLKLDFHPTNVIESLPKELNPPLKEQQFALRASFCAGLGCPEDRSLDYIADLTLDEQMKLSEGGRREGLPFETLKCFCLDVYAVLHLERTNSTIKLRLDGLEIVDIRPEGLEDSIECYVKTIIKLSLLPRLTLQLEDLVFQINDFISVAPTPISADVPFNPSVTDDKVSVFVNIN